MKVLICGAGIIGRIYAGRLADAGHDTVILARGDTADELTERGITLRRGGLTLHTRPKVVTEAAVGSDYDVAFVAVRRDQVDAVMPLVESLSAARIAFLCNLPVGSGELVRRAGPDRTVLAFPGVGGYRDDDGAIRYEEISAQKTTVQDRGAVSEPVLTLLRSAWFPVEACAQMPDWLATHAVFIAGVGAAILAAGGDSTKLAADSRRVATMISAVGEGFRALQRGGITVIPGPLKFIFTLAPRFIAVPYWQGALRAPTGTVVIAPHMRASHHTEFPPLCEDVRRLVAGHGNTATLLKLMDEASVYA